MTGSQNASLLANDALQAISVIPSRPLTPPELVANGPTISSRQAALEPVDDSVWLSISTLEEQLARINEFINLLRSERDKRWWTGVVYQLVMIATLVTSIVGFSSDDRSTRGVSITFAFTSLIAELDFLIWQFRYLTNLKPMERPEVTKCCSYLRCTYWLNASLYNYSSEDLQRLRDWGRENKIFIFSADNIDQFEKFYKHSVPQLPLEYQYRQMKLASGVKRAEVKEKEVRNELKKKRELTQLAKEATNILKENHVLKEHIHLIHLYLFGAKQQRNTHHTPHPSCAARTPPSPTGGEGTC